MSFRLNPGSKDIIITAARSSFAEYLDADSLFLIRDVDPVEMKVFAEGSPEREPSSETLLHFAIYQARPDVMAILHGHCPSITKHSIEMGIPTTHQFVESGTNLIVESVMEIIDSHLFIEIKDHGFLAMAASIEEAGQLSMEMFGKSLAIS
jgi:ribulose-5-phosphate 4-epimerase/fuculose-1-phosphate aldolase